MMRPLELDLTAAYALMRDEIVGQLRASAERGDTPEDFIMRVKDMVGEHEDTLLERALKVDLFPIQLSMGADVVEKVRNPWPVGAIHNNNGVLWLRVSDQNHNWNDYKRLGKAPAGWVQGDPIPKQHLGNVPQEFRDKLTAGGGHKMVQVGPTQRGGWQVPVKKVRAPAGAKKMTGIDELFARAIPGKSAHHAGRGFGGAPPPGYDKAEWEKFPYVAKIRVKPRAFPGPQDEWDKMDYEEKARANPDHFAAQIIAARLDKGGCGAVDVDGIAARWKQLPVSRIAEKAKIWLGEDPNRKIPAHANVPFRHRAAHRHVAWAPPRPVAPAAPSGPPIEPEAGHVPHPAPKEATALPGDDHHKALLAASVASWKRLREDVTAGQGAREGINPSYVVKLKVGTKEVKGLYKPHVGPYNLRGSEEGTYIVDRALGINRVPNTVFYEATFPGAIAHGEAHNLAGRKMRGSWQEWALDSGSKADDTPGWEGKVPKEEVMRIATLDYVIGNTDRHELNFLVSHDCKMVTAIDNGLCFMPKGRDGRPFKVGAWRNGALDGKDFKPPEDIMGKVKALDVAKLKADLAATGMNDEGLDLAMERLQKLKDTGIVSRRNMV